MVEELEGMIEFVSKGGDINSSDILKKLGAMLESAKSGKVGYKIEAGREYMIFRNEYNGNTFYKIQITGKNYDKTIKKAYKVVRFMSGIDIPDKTLIKINAGFEDFYFGKDKFNAVYTIVITDFDIIQTSDHTQREALEEYKQTVNGGGEEW